MRVHLPLLIAYAAALVGLGLWLGRRVRDSGGFFVAGRRLGPGLLFATMLAANIGAGSTVGATGLGYRDGWSAWWWVGSAGLGSIVLALAVGPRIRRLAAEHDLHTVGDFLELRYGRAVRGLVAAVLWVGTLAILAGQLIALAWVLQVVADVPKWAGCLAGGAVMTLYFRAGGLFTSAWVNLVQLAVMLAGFALALPLALSRAGGWASVHAAVDAPAAYWSPWGDVTTPLAYVGMLAPAFVVSPGLLQKVYGARDDRAVRLGVGANALALLLFALVPAALGILARALHPGLEQPELALPTLLTRDVSPLVGSLGLAAVVSAEVSSADAILFMLATSLSRDLYRGFVAPHASDAQVLRVARRSALAGGVLGVVLALLAETVIGALSFFYTVLSVGLFVPILAGLYVRRAGRPEAMMALAAGALTLVAGRLAGGGAVAGIPLPVLGLLATVVACAASLAWRGRTEGEVA